ncbi:hypothetical protein EBN03_10340 [Nocardia stercoris]|uniref:Uncharacterized protein n=2 Tax=Nocardia stercoris TaxID=2483361 RepID=A0A3M2L781_9NOCA|nr:hypothetical protein EBN03_10340 [Nocardia stercoris]
MSLLLNGVAAGAAAIACSAGLAAATTTPATAITTDGTFHLGVDIQPGTYTTTTAGTVCAWARLSGNAQGTATLQAGGAINGTTTVTIAPTDYAFVTTGCGTWNLTTTVSGGSSLFPSGTFGSS